jgi:molybdopterin molybdotransferase
MKDMLGREGVCTLEHACKLLKSSLDFKLPPILEIELHNALDRVIAEDIISPENLPNVIRSTMDGYAVNASDTFGASEAMPAYLTLVGEVVMGKKPCFEIKKSTAAKIPTGGMLPQGSDAVVMFEYASMIGSDTVEVLKPVAPGENTVQVGEDCKYGEIVLKKGHRIRPQDIGILAGIGIIHLRVYEKPRVSVIATGDEIIPHSEKTSPGQVRDINSYTLSALIEKSGGSAIKKGIIKDTYEELKKTADKSLQESDIVLITGGSSVGTKDVTEKVINGLGQPGVIFHGVSIKPGKPVIGGIVKGKPIFGLPGHPAAVIVCFELFIKPLIRIMSGETEKLIHKLKRTVRAKITKNISSSPGRQDYIRVMLEEREGKLLAIPILGKSGLITTMVKADGTIVIPLHETGIEKGTEVEVELF